MKIGDVISDIPFVHAIGKLTGCVDPATNQLRPESTCAKVKQDLNEGRFKDAFYDRFVYRKKKEK